VGLMTAVPQVKKTSFVGLMTVLQVVMTPFVGRMTVIMTPFVGLMTVSGGNDTICGWLICYFKSQ
ncbi:MAG: hypothetical protein AB2693_19360, partial [Candidatus Thiodiazotropha sp.]